jgi:predicted phosphodiesterase
MMSDMATSVPMKLRIKKLLEFDNIDFWLVSGDIVHTEFDKEWKNKSNRG